MEKIENKIETLFELERYSDVLELAYEHLYSSDADKERLYEYIILSHMNLSQDKKALSRCDEALKLYPSSFVFLYLKAKTLYHLSQYKKANKCVKQVLQFSPNHTQSLNLYARILLQQNDFKEAHSAIQKALEIDSNISEYQLTLVLVLMMLDKKKQANEVVQNVLTDDPHNIEALHLKQKLFATTPKHKERLLRSILFLDPFDTQSQKDLKFLRFYYKTVPFIMVLVLMLTYYLQSNYPKYSNYDSLHIVLIVIVGMVGSYDWRINIPFLAAILTINSYYLSSGGFELSELIGIFILSPITHFILKVFMTLLRVGKYRVEEAIEWMKN
ncbi:tetratricopeptide repeat protein [Sulfurimonas sp. NWX79]|uniref:tetratricopeptide repeat protein n=1 Tax=Sulfurimonas sp. NWX79 TaxID=2925412 RepID=UPI0032049EB6